MKNNAATKDNIFDDDELRKFLLDQRIDVLECFFLREKFISRQTEANRNQIDDSAYIDDLQTQSILIKSLFEKYGKIKHIDIIPYGISKTNNIKPETTVYVTYEEAQSVNKCVTYLDNSSIPIGIIGHGNGKLRISTNYLHEYKIPNKAVKMIDLQKLENELKLKFSCQLIHKEKQDTKYDRDLITLKSIDQCKLDESVRFADRILKPVQLNLPYFKYDQLRKILNKSNDLNNQENLEKKYKIYIHKDARFNQLNFYGEQQTSCYIRDKLVGMLNEVNSNFVEISIKSFKAIVGKHGETLNWLRDEFRGEISLDFRNKKIKLESKESQVDKFKKYIQNLEDTYVKSASVKNRVNDSSNSCPICLDELSNPIKLALCDHSFCFECIQSQYISFDQISSSELNCIVCNSSIAMCDLKLLAGQSDENLQKKCLISFEKYMLNRNMHNFIYCSDCNYIIKRKTENKCEKCQKKINQIKINEQLTENYFKEKSKHIKPCPGCGSYVEKFEGCNHITCSCKTHFCWICGFVGKTGDDVYKHQRNCSNNN